MAEIHLISDDSLGGIQREYVEEPERCFGYDDYVIIKHPDYKDAIVKFHEGFTAPNGCHIVLLDPTDIVQVDGTRYRMVERKAAVGERVVIEQYSEDITGIKRGDIVTRTESGEYSDGSISVGDNGFVDTSIGDKYRVLVPLEESAEEVTVDATQASPQVIDMLANLVQRIVALEKQAEDNTQIQTFKYSDLNGKTLRIYSAQDVDSGLIVRTTIGVDEATGKTYLLANESEVVE